MADRLNQGTELLLLRLRDRIAEKKLAIATANMELELAGSWQCDHAGYVRDVVQPEIDSLSLKIERELMMRELA